MIAETTPLLENGLIQLGFAGFSVLLLGLLFWTIKQLIAVITKNNSVLAKIIDTNKETSEGLDGVKFQLIDVKDEMRKIHEDFITRPCMNPTSTRGGNT